MTEPYPHDHDGPADTGGAVVGFDEQNGPPEHDPDCGCGHCPDWSW